MRSPPLRSDDISPPNNTMSTAGLPDSAGRGGPSGAHEDSPPIANSGSTFGSDGTGTVGYLAATPNSSGSESQSVKTGENIALGNLSTDIGESSGPDERAAFKRKLLLGAAAVAFLALGAVGYFYFAADDSKQVTSSLPPPEQAPSTQRRDSAEPARPPSSTISPESVPNPTAPSTPRDAASPSPPRDAVAPSPRPGEAAAPLTTSPGSSSPPSGASPPLRPAETAAPSIPTAPSPRDPPPPTSREVVFVQRPGVNVRSEPSTTARILGSANQGNQFKVVRRQGEWVQVEGDTASGWIHGRFLGQNAPRPR